MCGFIFSREPVGRVKRLLQSPTALVTVLVTVIWVFGYAVGADWWLIALIVGYAVGIPISSVLLEGNPPSSGSPASVSGESTRQTEETRRNGSAGDEPTRDGQGRERRGANTNSTADALETLRERYAAGDLSEAQFEAKLEQLLETETVEDASAYVETNETDDTPEEVDREPTRETERE